MPDTVMTGKPLVPALLNETLPGNNKTCEGTSRYQVIGIGDSIVSIVEGSHFQAPINGHVLAYDNGLQVTIIYQCDDGYNLTGSASRTCMSDGRWTRHLPQCREISAPKGTQS